MNHLAHVFLAGAQPDAQLGGMLGDFWRGAPDPSWRAGVGAGVILHRKIDVYTDSHPIVADARRLFDPPLRRFAGILLDVYFDHVLARQWQRFSDDSLSALSRRTLDLLAANATWLPADLTRFAHYMRAHGLFDSYAQRTTIEQVLSGIGRRLSRANPVGDAAPELWRRDIELAEIFANFFVELRDFAKMQRPLLGLIAE